MGILAGFERDANGNWRPKRQKMDVLVDELRAAQERESAAGGRFDKMYEEQLRRYDPAKALETYTRGAVGTAREEMDARLEALREDSAAGGRLNTGFFDEDQGRVVRDVESRLENTLMGAAMATSDRDFARTRAIGEYGQQRREAGYDFLAGAADREQARLNAKELRKSQKKGFGDYLGQGLGMAGSYFGGM